MPAERAASADLQGGTPDRVAVAIGLDHLEGQCYRTFFPRSELGFLGERERLEGAVISTLLFQKIPVARRRVAGKMAP
jgi:hypothetical protein